MCAIVDANVAHEVFGSHLQPAGERFFNWINKGSGRLVIGGKLLEELESSSQKLRDWLKQARIAGRMREIKNEVVAERTEQIREANLCRSNDPHILALAQLSGARLLYSNDATLQKDFGDKKLVDHPRGKIYTTLESKDFKKSHKKLLGATNLCKAG